MARVRRVALGYALVFSVVHLLLWLSVLPTLLTAMVQPQPFAERLSGGLVALGLGAFGGAATYLTLRALSRVSVRIGAALLGVAAAYLLLFGLGFLAIPGPAGDLGEPTRTLAGIGLFLHIPLLFLAVGFGGLLGAGEVFAATYALSLLLAGVLAIRAARRGVDGGPGRR